MSTPIENNTAALNALLDKANALPDAGSGSGSAEAVLYTPQELTAEQQAQARTNIGAASADTVSRLSKEIDNKVSIVPQMFTDKQKAQARANIRAAGLDPDCHAEYFQITDDGVVSLKPEYRGATSNSTYTNSISDMGAGVAGSKNTELPTHLVIPEIVDGIVVNNLSDGMFCDNTVIEYATLPRTVKDIPDYCFNSSYYLKEVYNTENIITLGIRAFCRCSSLVRMNFPNLTSMRAGAAFTCASLVYADIGKVESVPNLAFVYDANLQRVKNAGNITDIGPTAFLKCAKLKYFENFSSLKSIGDTGFWGSGIPYADYQSLSDCSFGTYATPLQVNPNDFWSGCTYTPCENPLPTYLCQYNPSWMNRLIGTSGKTHGQACMLYSVVLAYCGLHNVTLSNAEELEALVNSINPSILANFNTNYTYQATIADGLGLTRQTYASINQTVLQTLYDALAAGKYAVASISNGSNGSLKGHTVVIYGVNNKGELMICDSAIYRCDDYTVPFLYSMPYQNIIAPSIAGRNEVINIYSLS